MAKRILPCASVLAVLLTLPSSAASQTWNFTQMTPEQFESLPAGGPAPRHDISGIWDGGRAGIGAANQEAARAAARTPFTPLGEEMARRNRPGNGPRKAPVAEINDPVTTMGDPAGFPRQVTFLL